MQDLVEKQYAIDMRVLVAVNRPKSTSSLLGYTLV